MFDDRSNSRLQTRVSRVLHLHRNRHSAKDISANLRPANLVLPREISATDSRRTAYDRALW
jgi:hypothetical protein